MKQNFLPNIFDDLNQFYRLFTADECHSSQDCRGSLRGLSLSEDEQKLYIDAHLPGVKSEEVEVILDPKKRSLKIQGEGNLGREHVQYHIKSSQSYCYEIPLSNEIDLDTPIEAISKNGVLSITLLKNKSNQPQKIEVRVA